VPEAVGVDVTDGVGGGERVPEGVDPKVGVDDADPVPEEVTVRDDDGVPDGVCVGVAVAVGSASITRVSKGAVRIILPPNEKKHSGTPL
jgi:hypothetical protein